MFNNIITKEIKWGEKTLKIETGKIARQASASVVVSMGDTVVLCTVVGKKEANPDAAFFPLTVHYQEKFYATGRIPGGFLKRESKPSEREVLISRLIDRPIRPLFPENYFNEVQVICQTLSYDGENDPAILALIGTSAALSASDIPLTEAVGAARVGYKNGKFILNPSKEDRESLDLVVSGTESSVLMVESEAKELPEETMLEAVMFGHEAFQPIIKLINEFASEVGNKKQEVSSNKSSALLDQVLSSFEKGIAKAYSESQKQLRNQNVSDLRSKAILEIASEQASESSVGQAFDEACKKIVREKILKKKTRIDGRKLDEIRTIVCELDILPRAHGSALFTRGETQSLVVTTLGTSQDEQMVDDLMGNTSQRFMLHYNFPPYSVGEASALRAPGRREIGHGKLALKALEAVLPQADKFPYTIRLVSEITESNGSSSMASVCGASLSMMASGIPITRPVSGIAMGLIKQGKDFAVLSDIMGDEDHLGDMDFKVAGTEKGITALQMDIKINGIDREIMEIALNQAKQGRDHILAEMQKAIASPRENMSEYAPRIVSFQINKDKIRDVIGSGGKVIREICELSGAKVDIEDAGIISVSGISKQSIDTAMKMIQDIVSEPEVGVVYDGTVVKVTSFGAFVRFLGNTEGLLHISEISDDRVEDINDVIKEGQSLKVKVSGFERGGKIRLTAKNLEGTDESNYNSESDESGRKPKNFGSQSSGGRRDGGRRDGERRDGGRRDGEKRDGGRRDGERRDGERRDGGRRDGERRDGERRDGGRRDGERRDGGRRDGGRRDGGRRDGEREKPSRNFSSGSNNEESNKSEAKKRRLFW